MNNLALLLFSTIILCQLKILIFKDVTIEGSSFGSLEESDEVQSLPSVTDQFPAPGLEIHNQYYDDSYEDNNANEEIDEDYENVPAKKCYKPYYGAGGALVLLIYSCIRYIRRLNQNKINIKL